MRAGIFCDHATLGATVNTQISEDGDVARLVVNAGAGRLGRVPPRARPRGTNCSNFAGREIRSVNQFKSALGIYPKEWRLPLTYKRRQREEGNARPADELHAAGDPQGPAARAPRRRPSRRHSARGPRSSRSGRASPTTTSTSSNATACWPTPKKLADYSIADRRLGLDRHLRPRGPRRRLPRSRWSRSLTRPTRRRPTRWSPFSSA